METALTQAIASGSGAADIARALRWTADAIADSESSRIDVSMLGDHELDEEDSYVAEDDSDDARSLESDSELPAALSVPHLRLVLASFARKRHALLVPPAAEGAGAVAGGGMVVLPDGVLLAQALRNMLAFEAQPAVAVSAADQPPSPGGKRLRDLTWAELAGDALGTPAAFGNLASLSTELDPAVRRATEVYAAEYASGGAGSAGGAEDAKDAENAKNAENAEAPVMRLQPLDVTTPYLQAAKAHLAHYLFPTLRPQDLELLPNKLCRYLGGDHFTWHVDTPREGTIASFVVCLGIATPVDASTSGAGAGRDWRWLSPEESLAVGGLELLLPPEEQADAPAEVPLPQADGEESGKPTAGQQHGKRQRTVPRGAAVTEVRVSAASPGSGQHPGEGADTEKLRVMRVSTGAVAFYRNVKHRVPALPQQASAQGGDLGEPGLAGKPVARFSMTFSVRLAPGAKLPADGGDEAERDLIALREEKEQQEKEEFDEEGVVVGRAIRRDVRLVRVMEVLADFITRQQTGLGILGAERYSWYEKQAHLFKAEDLALEALQAYMKANAIPFHSAIRFSYVQEWITQYEQGRVERNNTWHEVDENALLALVKEAKGDVSAAEHEAAEARRAQKLKSRVATEFAKACDAVAKGAMYAPVPESASGSDSESEPCPRFSVANYIPLHAFREQDEVTLQHASYTGNECESGLEKATYGTHGLFIPPSPQLAAWLARLRGEAVAAKEDV